MTGSRHPLKKDEQAIVDLLADGIPRTTADIVRVLADGDFVSQRTAARDVARIVPHLCYWGYVRRLIYSGGIRDRLVGAQTVGPVCQACWWGGDPALDPDFHVATCSLCGAVTHDGIYAPVSGIKVVASAEEQHPTEVPRFLGRIDGPAPDPATWACKIGEIDRAKLPPGADAPMRHAVEDAYFKLTGEQARFIFSGWGAELDEPERAVVEERLPCDDDWIEEEDYRS